MPVQSRNDEIVYSERRRDFITYIGSRARRDSTGKFYYVSELLNIPEVRFQICLQEKVLNEIKDGKQESVKEVDEVITQVDEELKKRFDYKE